MRHDILKLLIAVIAILMSFYMFFSFILKLETNLMRVYDERSNKLEGATLQPLPEKT